VAGGLQGKAIIFWAKATFFGHKPAAKSEKKIFFFVFIKRNNGTHSV